MESFCRDLADRRHFSLGEVFPREEQRLRAVPVVSIRAWLPASIPIEVWPRPLVRVRLRALTRFEASLRVWIHEWLQVGLSRFWAWPLVLIHA